MATVDELLKQQSSVQGASAANTAAPTTTTTPTEGENRINAMFDAQKEAQLGSLKTAYDKSMSAAQQAKDKISPQYQTSANDLAVQYERNRRNFNQQAAANGLNTGTASQAALAQNNEYLRDFGTLRKSESEALAAADKSMADLTIEYENNAKAAVADNDYKRMAALLDQYNADKKEALAKAETLASYGNFSSFASLYGQEIADSMKANWAAGNPQLALMTGAITNDQYQNLASGRPMNEGLDANGNRIAGVVGSGSGSRSDPWDYGGSGWNPSNSTAMNNVANLAQAAGSVQEAKNIINNSSISTTDKNYLNSLLG